MNLQVWFLGDLSNESLKSEHGTFWISHQADSSYSICPFLLYEVDIVFYRLGKYFFGINPSVLNKNRYIIKQCPYTYCPLNATGLMELLLCSGSIGNIRLLQKTHHVIEAVEDICIFSIFS